MPKLPVQAVPTPVSFTIDRPLGLMRRASRQNLEQRYVRRKGGSISVETFLWDLKNGYIARGKQGGWTIKQRQGITKFNSVQKGTAEKFRGLFEVDFGGTKYVLARTGTSWSQYDEVDSFDDITGATGRGSDPASCAVSQANDSSGNRIYVLADGGALLKFGSALTAAALGGTPLATSVDAVHLHQHHLWYNDLDNPMSAHYAASDNAENHTKTGDAGTLKLNETLPFQDTLIGFVTIAEVYLAFIFRNHTVIYYAGTEPAEFTLQQIVNVSCISNRGIIQPKKSDVILSSDEGLNSLRSAIVHQATELDDLTLNVADLYDTFRGAVGAANLKQICGAWYPKLNHAYLSFPSADDPQILVYDPSIDEIVGRYQDIAAYSWLLREGGVLLMGGVRLHLRLRDFR